MAFRLLLLSILPALITIPSTTSFALNPHVETSKRPVIGILSVDIDKDLKKKYPFVESYISTFYVKFLQMGGARVVPIMINRNETYYRQWFSSINGVLFPGGGISLANSDYSKAAQILFNLTEEANKNGTYFPLWGTCLGFEMIIQLLSNDSLLTDCDANDIALPLNFTSDFHSSRLFRSAPDDIYYYLKLGNVTANYHKECLTPEKKKSSKLEGMIHVLSTNTDKKGQPFISSFESIHTPYYGVQFHPEKNPFEWSSKLHNVPHSREAVRVTQYFANFFVNEARKNDHAFASKDEEDLAVIENYYKNLYYLVNITMSERYMFNITQTTA